MRDAYSDLGHAYAEWRVVKELIEHEIRENNMRRTRENIQHWEPAPRIIEELGVIESKKASAINLAYDRVRQLERFRVSEQADGCSN